MPVSKCTIAIVEDDASFRRALERFLRASGFGAHTFASAEEFLGNVAPESYACLVLNIQLPGRSGFELIDHLTTSAPPVRDLHNRTGREKPAGASLQDS
jgi:FixJ family two-component response regulator